MKKTLFLFMALVAMLPVSAQIRGNSIEVKVVPDHQDWTYKVGETATFTISVTRSNTLLDNVTIDYAAGPEMYQDVKKSGVVLKNGTLTLKGKMTTPGFYRVDVTAHVNGKEYKGACGGSFLAREATTYDGDASRLHGLLAECHQRSPFHRFESHQTAVARALHEGRERL